MSQNESQSNASGPRVWRAKPAKKSFNVASWNVRTLKSTGKPELVIRELCHRKIDSCSLQETRASEECAIEVRCPDPLCSSSYTIYQSKSQNGQQGVAIALKSDLSQAVSAWSAISSLIIYVELDAKPLPITILSAYAPTDDASQSVKDTFYEDLHQTISRIPKKNVLVVAGDFNARITPKSNEFTGQYSISTTTTDNGHRLQSLSETHQLLLTNTFFPQRNSSWLATWRSPNGQHKNQIDYILMRKRWKSSLINSRSFWEPSDRTLSDHAVLVTTFKLRLRDFKKKEKIQRVAIERFKLPDVRNKYRALLEAETETDTTTSLDERWSRFAELITSSAKTACGVRKRKVPKWISEETLKRVDLASHASHAMKKQARAEIRTAIQSDRDAYWTSIAEEMEKANRVGDIKRLYDLLKTASLTKKVTTHVVKDRNGVEIKSKSEALNRWSEHFEKLLNRPPPTGSDDIALHSCVSEGLNLPVGSEDAPEISEIVEAIKRMKSGKAPGLDNIRPEMLKAAPEATALLLKPIFDEIWSHETIPTEWQTSCLLPFHKKGDKKDCNNYRGITLLSLASKVLESIVLARFSPAKDMLFREEQAGFRKSRGCVDQIFSLRQILQLRHEYRMPTVVVFVDFKAAFDSVNRDCLWALLEADNLPPKLVRIFKAIYHRTKSIVRIGHDESSPFDVYTGVRQGAISSPILFNYTIDWVMSNALDSVKFAGKTPGVEIYDGRLVDLAYADDIALVCDNADTMQTLISAVNHYASMLGLVINANKTKTMFANMPPAALVVDSTSLDTVDSFVYLGSEITPNGSSLKDSDSRMQKARAVFQRLWHVLWKRSDVSLKTKMRIYRASVRTVLLYAAETWSPTKAAIRSISVFENRRSLAHIDWTERKTNVYVRKLCQVNTLEEELKCRRLKLLGHVLRMDPLRIPRRTFLTEPQVEWKRPPGGVLKTWRQLATHDVTSTLPRRKIKGNHKKWAANSSEWKRFLLPIVSDRDQWRQYCNDAVTTPTSDGRP
ncbi:MAG: reverse transcriptase domain-containing protein, partial [Verrucomicrobiota bacterium]